MRTRPYGAVLIAIALCAAVMMLHTDSGGMVVYEAKEATMPVQQDGHVKDTISKEKAEATATVGTESAAATAEAPVQEAITAPAMQGDFPKLAEKFSKGVVQIMVVKAKHNWLSPQKPPSTEEVSGSGFFIDNTHLGPKLSRSDDLHIVTNAHVAQDALEVTVRLPKTGLLKIKVSVVGLSPPDEHDIALLRIDDKEDIKKAFKMHLGTEDLEKGLIRLPLGNSDLVKAGEKLMALGYPEGLPGVKSTLGVMSGYQEMERKLYMQMTTPINPGNSGGPLISKEGTVSGINTAGIQGSENIGFSIPSAVLIAILPVLAEHRVFTIPIFGLVLVPTGDNQKELYGMPADMARGEFIAEVYEGGMAHASGMKHGDILYEIDGMALSRRGQMFLNKIQTYVSLDGYLGRTNLNSMVHCKVWRVDKSVDIELKYAITPHRAIPLIHEAALKPQPYQIRGGIVFSPLTQNYLKQMTTPMSLSDGSAVVAAPKLTKYGVYPHDRVEPKVVIADVVSSSIGEATKVFDSGMVVVKVNGAKVTTMDELCAVLSKPVKDAKGTEWLTIESEDGIFGAIEMSDVIENDKKLAAMQLYAPTTCPDSSDGDGVPSAMAKQWSDAASHRHSTNNL